MSVEAGLRGLSVLFVDDDPGIRDMAGRWLNKIGCRFEAAANGHEAIRALEREPYDVAVVDIIMPDKEGLETILEISQRWPKLGLVAISGGGRIDPEEFLHLAKVFGARQTLRKPFKLGMLLQALSDARNPPGQDACAA